MRRAGGRRGRERAGRARGTAAHEHTAPSCAGVRAATTPHAARARQERRQRVGARAHLGGAACADAVPAAQRRGAARRQRSRRRHAASTLRALAQDGRARRALRSARRPARAHGRLVHAASQQRAGAVGLRAAVWGRRRACVSFELAATGGRVCAVPPLVWWRASARARATLVATAGRVSEAYWGAARGVSEQRAAAAAVVGGIPWGISAGGTASSAHAC
jgi:hypothetical protein